MADLGNAWHIPGNPEPRGRGAMRDPVGALFPGTIITIFSGSQHQGAGGNPGNQLQVGSSIFFKRSMDAAWTEIPMTFQSATDNNKYYSGTIPAGTFQAGDVVQYYLRIPYSDHETTFLQANGPGSSTTADETAARAAPFTFTLEASATRGQLAFSRILIVFLENQPNEDVHEAPYLETLKSRGVFLKTYFGISHPSEPNYVAAISGSTFGIKDDNNYELNETTVVDLLEAKGVSWKAYMEDMPTDDKLVSRHDLYVRKHNPFVSFKTVASKPDRLAKVVNAVEFVHDLASNSLPEYCWYSPNLNNDGHDTGIKHASEWLRGFLEPLLGKPEFAAATLVVITFDERFPDSDNHLYSIVIGPGATAGTVDVTRHDHYSLLRTVEENWSLGTLGRSDNNATWLSFLWDLPPTATTPEDHN